jgi:hypothetical protein
MKPDSIIQELIYDFWRGFRSGLCRTAYALMYVARATTKTQVGWTEYTDIMNHLKENIL